MTRLTTARVLGAVLAVPAFVLLQGYRDVRVQLLESKLAIDITNQITAVNEPSTAWPETLLGVLLAGALLALVAPGRAGRLSRSLPLLVATALLAAVLGIGMAVTDPPSVVDWLDPGTFELWSHWARTGVHGAAAPALLGVLLVLCVSAIRGARRGARSTQDRQS